jgi:hypothetical protein
MEERRERGRTEKLRKDDGRRNYGSAGEGSNEGIREGSRRRQEEAKGRARTVREEEVRRESESVVAVHNGQFLNRRKCEREMLSFFSI